MDRNPAVLYKGLVVGVIVLFIGVGINPAIATVEPDNSTLEEITIQFYETNKTYNHTVMLTREQVEELENLINDFEIKIDSADNRLETEAIYKDTVVSLNDIGILPEGMSIEKAQRLVTGKEHNPIAVRLFERWFNRNQGKIGDNENFLCLIGGWYSYEMRCTRGIMTILTPIWNNFFRTIYNIGEKYPLLEELFHDILLGLIELPAAIWIIRPFQVGFELFFGDKYEYPHETLYKACKLDIIILGLNGMQKFKGKWFGHLPLPPFLYLINEQEKKLIFTYPGAVGFTGIKIYDFISPYSDENLLLGSALRVKLGEEPPW